MFRLRWPQSPLALSLRSRVWRWLPFACYAAAAAALALAVVARSEAPIENELIFILDVSASVAEIPAETLRFCRQLAENADRVQTIWAAGVCRLAPPAGREIIMPRLDEAEGLIRSATDLETAIRFAASLPRSGRVRRRLILLSDGRENKGDAAAAARSLAAEARLDTVAIGRRPRRDARLLALSAPARVNSGQPFAVKILAEAEPAAMAEIRLRDQDGNWLAGWTTAAHEAGTQLDGQVQVQGSGIITLDAAIAVEGDEIPENDRCRAVLLARSPPQLLWVGNAPPPWLTFPALHVEPGVFEPRILRSCAGVVLDDVAAGDLPAGAEDVLREAVAAGKGLLVIGGEHSLGADDYRVNRGGAATLAELLPVRLMPSRYLAVVFALDTSGSMAESAEAGGGVNKISLACTALERCWLRLGAGDLGGVIGFAENARTIMPLTLIEDDRDDPSQVQLRITLMEQTARGGTRVFDGLAKSLDMLRSAVTEKKYIVAITDGATVETGEERERALANICERLRAERVGLWLIAVGEDADKPLLEALARGSGGEVLWCQGKRMLELPAVLADVLRRSRSFKRENGRVAALPRHPAVRSLALADLPPVARYMAVGPPRQRGGATALITATSGEPLAAAWRLGLGRVAFVAGAPWRDWGWEGSPAVAQMANDLIAWCLGQSETAAEGEMALWLKGEKLHIEFTPPAEAAASEFAVQWEKIMPVDTRDPADGASSGEIALLPVRQHLWQAEARLLLSEGIYRFDAVAKKNALLLASAPLLVERREEWLRLGPDGAALARIAAAGGGDFLSTGRSLPPWDSVPVSGSAPEPRGALYLLGMGLVLFILGLAAAGWR